FDHEFQAVGDEVDIVATYRHLLSEMRALQRNAPETMPEDALLIRHGRAEPPGCCYPKNDRALARSGHQPIVHAKQQPALVTSCHQPMRSAVRHTIEKRSASAASSARCRSAAAMTPLPSACGRSRVAEASASTVVW